MRAKTFFFSLVLFVSVVAAPKTGRTAPPPDAAVFDAVMINSSLQPESEAEAERLRHLTDSLRQALEKSGEYRIVDLTPIKNELNAVKAIFACNGCENDLAKKDGAQRAVVCWVQKVSDLILNINVRISDVETGKALKGGSVDIRGNNDQSWERGLKFLLEEHVFGDRP
jgi:hypothetical protein